MTKPFSNYIRDEHQEAARKLMENAPGWRNCEFCRCHTNARLRACCDKGRDVDRKANAELSGAEGIRS